MAEGSVGLTVHDESRDALGHPTVGGGVHGCPLLSVLAGDEGEGKHRSSWDHGGVTEHYTKLTCSFLREAYTL